MVCQPLRLALLIGAITAVAVSPVRANFRAPRCCDPCGSSAAGATAPAFRTVTCTEWVRENVPVKRTAYKVECVKETYDTFKCERVAKVVERTVVCKKNVPVWTEEVRKVCHKETVYEDKIVNKTSYKYVQETVNKKTLVRLGHWETKPATFGGGSGGGLFGGHGHGCCEKSCSKDPCGKASACNDSCGRTRKVWVSCPEYKCCPTTVCKKKCVTEAVKCKVAVCKHTWKEEKVKVCKMTCVEEKKVVKCTVWETKKVACKAERTVRKCVPYTETVNCCKWVQKTVTRQVPCNNASSSSASNACCDRASLRDRLRRCNDACTPDRGCRHHRERDCCK